MSTSFLSYYFCITSRANGLVSGGRLGRDQTSPAPLFAAAASRGQKPRPVSGSARCNMRPTPVAARTARRESEPPTKEPAIPRDQLAYLGRDGAGGAPRRDRAAETDRPRPAAAAIAATVFPPALSTFAAHWPAGAGA